MEEPLDKDSQLIRRISNNQNLLTMLMEFEHTLDNAGLFAYKNWFDGVLVNGPEVSKYWFTTTWMYPYKKMPDPKGAMRLLKYGCKVKFDTDYYLVPNKIIGPGSYSDRRTKDAKLLEFKVWLVTITMPRKFIDEGMDDLLDIEIQKVDDELDQQDQFPEENTEMETGGGNPDIDNDFGGEENPAPGQETNLSPPMGGPNV